MTIYIILYISIIIGLLAKVCAPNNNYNRYYWFVGIALILVCGFRHETLGLDTSNYLDLYENPNDMSGFYQFGSIEPGIKWLNAVLRFLWIDRNLYQIIFAAISITPVFYFAKKHSNNEFLFLLLFCSYSVGMSLFFLNFNAMRQCLAIGLVCLVVNYYLTHDRKINKKIILALITLYFFHHSSLLVALLLVMDKISLKKKHYYAIIIISLVAGYIVDYYSDIINSIVGVTDFSFYFTNVTEDQFSIRSLVPYALINIAIIYLQEEEKLDNLFFKGLVLSNLVCGVMAFYGNNVDRMAAYFYVFACIYISQILPSLKTNKKLIVMGMWFCILGYFSYKIFAILQSSGAHNLIPYKSFL